jgi:hypothetical protein
MLELRVFGVFAILFAFVLLVILIGLLHNINNFFYF